MCYYMSGVFVFVCRHTLQHHLLDAQYPSDNPPSEKQNGLKLACLIFLPPTPARECRADYHLTNILQNGECQRLSAIILLILNLCNIPPCQGLSISKRQCLYALGYI